jgi:hypothetical protein
MPMNSDALATLVNNDCGVPTPPDGPRPSARASWEMDSSVVAFGYHQVTTARLAAQQESPGAPPPPTPTMARPPRQTRQAMNRRPQRRSPIGPRRPAARDRSDLAAGQRAAAEHPSDQDPLDLLVTGIVRNLRYSSRSVAADGSWRAAWHGPDRGGPLSTGSSLGHSRAGRHPMAGAVLRLSCDVVGTRGAALHRGQRLMAQ